MPVVEVTAYLSTQIAAREQVHLDSILMAMHPDVGAHMSRATPIADVRNPPIPIFSLPWRAQFGVPLCTAWRMHRDSRVGIERIVKRKDPQDVEERASVWTPSSGPEKNYMLPLPMVLTPTVSWLAVGNRRAILELLRRVRQIGSTRRHGYGIVSGWEATTVEADPIRTLVDEYGKAARFLPESWVSEADAVEIGPVAPPYWHPAMATGRVRPGVQCVLRPEIVDRVARCR